MLLLFQLGILIFNKHIFIVKSISSMLLNKKSFSYKTGVEVVGNSLLMV